jgi:hypothetical protein
MVAFQIRINGTPHCETEDITAVTIVAEHVARAGVERVSIHASSGAEEKLQWLGAHLGVGDEIQIRIVDAAEIKDTAPDACSFCGRDIHELEKIVQGMDVSICDGCISSFAEALRESARLPLGASIRDGADQHCGFCRSKSGVVAGVIVRNEAAICPECLRACKDITTTP